MGSRASLDAPHDRIGSHLNRRVQLEFPSDSPANVAPTPNLDVLEEMFLRKRKKDGFARSRGHLSCDSEEVQSIGCTRCQDVSPWKR